MATTLLSGPSDPLLVSPTADVVEPPSVSDPTLSGIVNEDAPYEVRVKAARLFEDDAVNGIADAPIDSKHKDAAIKFLDKDIAIANAQLFKDWQSSKVMEEFPTIAERDDFVAAAVKGGNNPDAYSNPRHSQFIADLNETSGNLFGGLNRSWTGEAKTPSGYKVAGYTVKPMSNGEAVVNLKMQGQEPTEALAVPSPSPVTVRHPELDKGWDSFSKSIKIKLPTDDDVTTELGKTDERLSAIKQEIEQRKSLTASTQKPGFFNDPLAAGAVGIANLQASNQLEAERKSLLQRRDSLTKDGKRVLANERVADSIRTNPELVAQIRDKGVGERLANATESLVMSLNVVGEEVGLPWQQGARAGAAEAQSIKGELGLGMEQAEFRGTMADKIGIATVENMPLLALQAGASGAGIAASMGPMAVASYGQNLVAAESSAQAAEDSGDIEGAKKIRDNARAYAGLMAMADIGTEMMFGPEGAPLSKAARGMTALNRFVKAPTKEGIEEIGAGVIQSQFAPLIGKYEEAFNSDRIVEFGAGFFGSQMQQVPGAMLNRQQTPQQQIEAAKEQLQTIAANMGVNVYDKTPDEIDITAKAVPTVDDAGKPSSIPNLFGMEQKDGSQNWSIQDPWLRQRAFQAGVKSEFPTEEEAQQFAATMHETVAKAELTQAAQQSGIPQEQIDSGITLITSALRQAAIAEQQPDAALWARYQFTFAPQVPVSEESIPDTRNEPSNIPPTGAQLDTPAQQSAQAIENTLTGEERVRQSAVGGKLLADRLRTQETATAEAPEMTAAWEKRRAHALAMQDQEPAYVADAQGHPAVTTTLTALDAYDAAQDDDAKLEVLNDIQPATVAAAERIAENTIAKIEADESLNDEEKKAMTEKWWKFAEDIKSVRVAAPESSFTKIEAPAPSAPSRESEAEAIEASPPASSQTPAANLPVAQPVGETSVPANTENATPARDATKPEQMTPEEFDEYVKQSGREYYLKHGKNAPMRTGQLNILQDAIEKKLPVSVAAFDAQVEKGRPITLPEGYVQDGELYVFQEQATPATPPLETRLQEGREAVSKKQKAPMAAAAPQTTQPGTKLKAKIEGTVQEVEYIRNNNDGTHQVKAGGVETSVRSGNLSENNGGALFQSRSSGVTPQQDAEYMAAVESGDVAEQQRLVDEAAKAAGYEMGFIHGTNAKEEFASFNPELATEKGTFWFEKKDGDSSYGKTMRVGLRFEKPFNAKRLGGYKTASEWARVFKEKGLEGLEIDPLFNWNEFGHWDSPNDTRKRTAIENLLAHSESSHPLFKNLRKVLVNAGYDGLLLPAEGFQFYNPSKRLAGSNAVAFAPNQIKSADPITRDDAGNVIPLSQRFNPESNSILYQSGQETGGTIKGKIETPEGTLRHAVVTLTSNSDVSTIMHEFIHGLALLETRTGANTTRSLLQSILGNKAPAFYAWASEGTEGMSADDAHVRMHERIAEGFEKWLTDGSLPAHKNQGMLRKAFESIRAAMRNIVRDMLGAGYDYKFINSSSPLPANVQASYQQLFALLDRDAVGVRDTTSLSMLQHIGANNAEALDALFPLTRAVGNRREALTPAELADISDRTGDSVEELAKQAAQSVKNSTLFQSLGEGLPADKAKYLIDAGTAAMVNAMAKNAGVMPTFDEWLGDIRQTANPAFNGLSNAALQTIHYASQLNIPAAKSVTVQQQVDAAIIAAEEAVTPESKEAFMDAINAVMPSLAPDMAKRLKVAATAAASAETGVERDRAMNAAMKIVRADARAKFSITAQQLTTLLRGYKLGSNNANQVRDIIAETKKTIVPLMKAGEVGNATKKMVNDALSLMENTANGSVDMSDVVDLMLLNIGEVKNDLARHAEMNFLRGVREGGKYAASQFKARQQAIIGVVLDNLKTVTGLSQQQTERAIKYIGAATTDKQLNKAVWKALLLFQDQRVRDAYNHVGQLQEVIKENIKKGKFGDMTDWVALFNSFETHTIPQHMLAQYLSLAEPLAAKDPVILLNGLKNQLESMNRQMTEWLEANPEDEQTRPPTLSNGLAEALERLAILDELDSAKRSRSQERFVTKQQEFGKSKPMAEEAARAISQMRVFETFEEADEDELVSTFTNRQLRGIVNSFINYNDGIVTPFLVQLAQGLKATRFQKQFLPNLTYGVRHFLRLSGDARLDADDAELRSNGMIGRVIGVIAGYRGMDDSAKNIEKQFRKAGIHNFDSMLNTASWINENVTQPMSKAQVVGLLERDRILTMKDEHGMSIKDYELALDDPSHYNESLLRAMRPEMASPVFSNPLARAVGEKVSNIKNARRELMSRIMGMAMHQRQREKNGMEGNYIEYILDGAFKRKGTAFVENEFKRQQAAARVIKTMLGTQKPTAANISAFLPQAAKQAMAHTRSIFDRTGQWTYFLNMIENEELLSMPEAYFPIMSMEENTTIEQRVKNLTGIPLGAIGSITPRVAPRAASRHARLNENLKMANADFFAVVNDAVHQAAADSAMTPFLKTMDRGMNGIQRLTNEDGNGLFGGTANNVVVELHKAMIEHGARMSHVILADPGVATRASSYIASIFPKMVLDKVQRPIVEGVGNLTTILTYGNQKQFASGLGAVWGGKGNNEAWGKLMLSLRAPTALRNGSESTTGPMQDLAASIDSAFAADPHAPTWTENLIAEIQNKKPQRQGLLQRSQSHVLARMTSAMRKLLVTAGEQMWIRPYWAGIFSDSIKQQTGSEFSFDAQQAGAYSEQVLNNAVSAAETEIARIMSPSARGAGRLVSQQSLDSDETTGLIKNMIYAMTNFIGAQSNTAKFAMKALVEGRAGNIDRRKAASNIIGLFMGNLVVNTASSFFVLAMRALIDSLRLEDDEEKNSVALQQFSEWLSSANPMNVKSSAVFWSKMGFRSAFSLRFGGLNTLMRFLVGTGTELTAWGIGTAAGGFKSGYDPFKDNLTFEAEPSITAISGYMLGISDDPALKRAFQNSNVFTATRMMGSVNAVVNLATALGNDVSSIARYTRGEGDALGATANLAVNIGMLLSSVPFYATLADSTGQMAKLESPWYKQYEDNALNRMARRAGKEYATTGEMRYKEQIDGMPKQYQKTARDEITKIKYLERASTVHGNPEATDRLKASFEAIRNEPEVSRHIKLAAEFRRMEEAGLKQKFLSGLRLLKTAESKWGSTFGSRGASAEFAQKLRAYEKEASGSTPAWNALYGN